LHHETRPTSERRYRTTCITERCPKPQTTRQTEHQAHIKQSRTSVKRIQIKFEPSFPESNARKRANSGIKRTRPKRKTQYDPCQTNNSGRNFMSTRSYLCQPSSPKPHHISFIPRQTLSYAQDRVPRTHIAYVSFITAVVQYFVSPASD
jgi:hypothetical protein